MRGGNDCNSGLKENFDLSSPKKDSKKRAAKNKRNRDIEAGEDANIETSIIVESSIIEPSEGLTRTLTWSRKNEQIYEAAGALHDKAMRVDGKRFNFEKKGKKYLGYKTSKNRYRFKDQDDYAMDKKQIRRDLVEIADILSKIAKRKIGESNYTGYAIYSVGLLAFYIANTSSSFIEGARCRRNKFTPQQVEELAARGNFTASNEACLSDTDSLLIYTACNFFLFNIALWSEQIGSYYLTRASATSALYLSLRNVKCGFFETHGKEDKSGILSKKLQFIQYIRLKFWQEIMLIKGYKSPKIFFSYCNDYQISIVDSKLVLGLYEYFVKAAKELNNSKELVDKLTGREGQILAETIVDTLCSIYERKLQKSWLLWNNFISYMEAQDVTYLVDSVLGTNLLMKEGHFTEQEIQHAKMFNSDSSETNSDKIFKKNSHSSEDEILDKKFTDCVNLKEKHIAFKTPNSQEFQESNIKSVKKKKPRKKISIKEADNEIEETSVTPIKHFKLEASQDKLEKKSTNLKEKKESLPANLLKYKSTGSMGMKISGDKTQSTKSISEKFYSPTIVNRFITDCLKSTIDQQNVTQETIDNIFGSFADEIPNMSDIIRVQNHISQKLLSRRNESNRRYFFLGSYVTLQAILASFVAIQDSSFIPLWYIFLTLQVVSLVGGVCLEFPKRAVHKVRDYWHNNLECFESSIRTLFSANLIRSDEETGALKSTVSMRNFQLITVCTIYMLCHSKKKDITQFNKYDLVYLTSHIIKTFVQFYKNENKINFEIKDTKQVSYIVKKLYRNLEEHYASCWVNLFQFDKPKALVVKNGVQSQMIYSIIQDSIYVTTNSSDLVNISNRMMLNFNITKEDPFSVHHAFIQVCIYAIRDYKLSCNVSMLNEKQQQKIADQILKYALRHKEIFQADGSGFDDERLKTKTDKMCEKITGLREEAIKRWSLSAASVVGISTIGGDLNV